jgi:predicted Zn-dependent protease
MGAGYSVPVLGRRISAYRYSADIVLLHETQVKYGNCVLSLTYTGVGRYDDAVQSGFRAVELDTGSFLARWTLQTALYLSGRLQEAVDAGRAALAMSGRLPPSMATLALSLADCGKTAEAEAVYAELTARARQEYVPPSTLAFATAAAARQDEMLHQVEDVLSIRDPLSCLILSLHWP